VFGDLYRCRMGRVVHLDIAAPVLGHSARPVAVLLLRSNPSRDLYPLIQKWPTASPTAETLLVRRAGERVLFLNALRHSTKPALSLSLPLTSRDVPAVQAALGTTGTMEGTDYRGRRVVAHIGRVPSSPWIMIAKLDRSEVSAEATWRSRSIAALVALTVAAAWALGAALVRTRRSAHLRDLLEAEQRVSRSHALLAATSDSVLVVEPETGRIADANEAAFSRLLYERDELVGLTILDIEPGLTPEAWAERVRKAREASGLLYEAPRIRKDRTEYPAEVGLRILQADGGEYLVATGRDITERVKAQEALRAAHAELERAARELAIRNRIAEAFLTSADHRMYFGVLDVLLEAFSSPYGVFGFISEEGDLVVPTMSRGVWDQCEKSDKSTVFSRDTWGDSAWPNAIRTQSLLYSNEPSRLIPPGHVAITRHLTAPIIHRGVVVGLFQVASKDTDYDAHEIALARTLAAAIAPILDARLKADREAAGRARAEARLKREAAALARSNQDLEQFAYAASHDLQEPLRMVTSYTQLLGQRYADKLDQDARDFIGFAVDGASRMQQLIQDLLEYSQVSTRARESVPFDPHVALGEALGNLQAAIQESGAVVTTSELPMLMGDSAQISRVFQNLIGNAIKFRKPDQAPIIHIYADTAPEEPDRCIVSVEDNGIGIETRHFDRIFAVFQRLHTRQDHPGNGIGLPLCRKIVERHGGRVWVDSEYGRGSTFRFTMPQAL